ncbi:MAG: hypothetical protein ABI670_02050 [Chloroflexota bacterium]
MDNTPEEERLRAHPKERFGSAENMLDMDEALRKLQAEDTPTRSGHRQITLDQFGPVTLVLFSFEAGGILKDHRASGVVTIQAIEGELIVRTDEQEHKLSPRTMVMLVPDVRHSVEAVTASAMLLTVCLVNSAAHR